MTAALSRVGVDRVADAIRAGGRGHKGALVGTRRLVRLVLRRDRVRLVLWVGGLIALMAVSAASVASLYQTPAQIQTYVSTVGDNPALIMFAGPGYGFDDANIGVILVNETTLWMSLGVALMSVFLVNRHTRAEEDSERSDLVRSLVVGRHAPMAATMLVAVCANLIVALGSALASIALGFPLVGSVALCAGVALVGVAFGAATGVAAQIAGSGRGALGLGAGFVGFAFVARGIGDVTAPVLSWATPFGWGIGVRAFAGERWWTLVGLGLISAVLVAVAFQLSDRRDLGSGLLSQRPGPEAASMSTRHPLGFAARLQRNVVIGWAIGVVLTGAVYGSIADDIEDMVADNPELADYLASISGATLTESFLATALRIIALAIAGFAISSALRPRAEEASGNAESMLAAPLSRWRWALHHVAVTVVAVCLLVIASGTSLGMSYAVVIGDSSQIGILAAASLATLPAVLILAGVAFVLFGWAPRATAVAWGLLAAVAIVSVFGTVLQLPSWVVDLSPLEHAPAVPAEAWAPRTLVLQSAVAIALFTFGLIGFRRRDFAPGG